MSKLFERYVVIHNSNPAISSADKTAALSVVGGVAVEETLHVGGVLHAESGIDCNGSSITGVGAAQAAGDVVTRAYLEGNVDGVSVEAEPGTGKFRLASTGLGPALAGGSGSPLSLVLEDASLHIDEESNQLKVQRDLALTRLTLDSPRNPGSRWRLASGISSVTEASEQLDLLAPSGNSSLTVRGDDGTIVVYGKARFVAGLSAGSSRITDVSEPVMATDACTKGYTDSVAQGLDPKDSVVAATTVAGVISTSFVAGSTIDGVVIAAGQRLLIKDQVDQRENGIYIVKPTGAPQRSLDMRTGMAVNGAYTFVEGGSINKGNGYCVTSPAGADVVGSNSLVFTQFSGAGMIITGNALTKSGNRLDVVIDNTSLEFAPTTTRIRIASGAISTGLSGGSGVPISVNANLPSVTGLGTIATGTWNATTISVPYGGTGVTSLAVDTFLLGGGTGPISPIGDVTYARATSTLRAVNTFASIASYAPAFQIGTSQATPQGGTLAHVSAAGAQFTNAAANDLALRSVGVLRFGSSTAAGANASSLDILTDGAIVGVRGDESTSLATGSVRLNGGMSIAKSLNVGLSISVGLTGNSAGAITAARGSLVDVRGSTFTNAVTPAAGTSADFSTFRIGQTTLASTATGIRTVNAASLYIAGPPIAGGNTTITNTTALTVESGAVVINDGTTSSSKDTGALVVKGGAGVSGDLFTGGAVVLSGSYLAVGGYATVGGTLTTSNTLTVNMPGTGNVSAAAFLQPNMATGSGNTMSIGQSLTSMNSGSLGFYSAGGAASASNYLKLQVSNQQSGLLVRGDGTVLTDAGLVVGNAQNVGTVTLGNQANALVGGILQSDQSHAIYLRYNKAGTGNRLAQYSFGDIEFYTNGAITAQTLKMSIAASGNVSIPAGSLTVSGGVTISGSTNVGNAVNPTSASGGAVNVVGDIVLGPGGEVYFSTGASAVGSPTAATRSNGSKLILYPSVGTLQLDYALGIENGAMWHSVFDASASYKWYAGATAAGPVNIMTLFGSGNLTLNSALNQPLSAYIRNTNTGTGAYAAVTLGNDTGINTTLFLNSSTRATDGPANSAVLRNDAGDLYLLSKGGSANVSGIRVAATTGAVSIPVSLTVGSNSTNPAFTVSGQGIVATIVNSTSAVSQTSLTIRNTVNGTSAYMGLDGNGLQAFTQDALTLYVDNGKPIQFLTPSRVETNAPIVMTNTTLFAAPTFTTRSAGTKLVLFPGVSATAVDYALGIEGATLWSSVPNSSGAFKWYAGTTNVMSLAGDAHGIRQAPADGAIITKGSEPFTSGKYYSASFPVSSYGLFMEPSAITVGGRNTAGKLFQVVGYNLDSTLVQRLSVDLGNGATNVSGTLGVTASGTATGPSASFIQPGLAAGSSNYINVGQAISAYNSGMLGFTNVGAGTTSNYLKLQVNGQSSGLIVRGDGAVLTDSSLAVGSSQNVGSITLGNQGGSTGGIISADQAHAIYLRYNLAGLVNTVAHYSYGDIQFYNNGLIGAQTLKLSISAAGNVAIPIATDAGSATDGAFRVTGGAGIGKTLHVGGEVVSYMGTGNGQFRAVSGNYGIIMRNDGADFYLLSTPSGTPLGTWSANRPFRYTIASNSIFSDAAWTFGNTSASSSPTSGALQVAGGLGVGGNLHVGGYTMVGTSGGGSSTVPNMLGFTGVSGDSSSTAAMNTAIVERIYSGSESSELLLFKGNDLAGTPGGQTSYV